jgi:hypothetical protein
MQTMAVAGVLGYFGLSGCADDPAPTPAEPTVQQIRTDADAHFEKLKQEERERSTQGY